MRPRSSASGGSPALREAIRAVGLPKRKPTEAGRHAVRPLRGPKPRVLPRQLAFDGNEAA
jgi:hypothetical protein